MEEQQQARTSQRAASQTESHVVWIGSGEERIPPAQRLRDNCLTFDFHPTLSHFLPRSLHSHTNLKAAVSSAAPPPVVIPASSLFALRVLLRASLSRDRRYPSGPLYLSGFASLRPPSVPVSLQASKPASQPSVVLTSHTGLVSLWPSITHPSVSSTALSACSHPFSREAAQDAWWTLYCVSFYPRPGSRLLCCAVL